MRLKHVKPTDYSIYVDLDGVLADLHKKMQEVTGHDLLDKESDREVKEDNEAWKEFHEKIAAGEQLFAELELLPDALQLWDYVKKYKPYILTATGRNNVEDVIEQKHRWVKEHLTNYKKIYTVVASRNKAKFAWPDSILIDDRMKSIQPWRDQKGIGIYHTSADDTIAQLKKYGL